MDRYVIMFSNGLYYHDVQSSTSRDVRFAEIIQNAHHFNSITGAEWAGTQSVKNNGLTFNIINRGE